MSLLLIDDHTVDSTGPEQGVIEEARRRQRRRWITLAALIAALGVGVAVWATGGDSHAARPRSRRADPASDVRASKLHRPGFSVRLTPSLDGSEYGWCVLVREGGSADGSGGCSMMPTSASPISYVSSSFSQSSSYEAVVAVTTPRVTFVMAGGRRVRPLALSGLPYGLRAVRILIPTKLVHRVVNGHTRLLRVPAPEPKLVALDSRGRSIPRGSLDRALLPSVQASQPPSPSPTGPCQLRALGLSGLAAQWSHVASAIRGYPAKVIGRAFFSCVDVEYYLHGWPLDAAILLDAAHPGITPAFIPGLEPVPGRRGFFNGPGGFKGQLSAKRTGDAWLVVAGGSGVAQRINVLGHLSATVRPYVVGRPPG